MVRKRQQQWDKTHIEKNLVKEYLESSLSGIHMAKEIEGCLIRTQEEEMNHIGKARKELHETTQNFKNLA